MTSRRSLGTETELKYYVSNGNAETPLSTLALVACTRRRVEEFLEDCKSYLGMTQYETRSQDSRFRLTGEPIPIESG